MERLRFNKASAWGLEGGRVLPINRPGGGLLLAKEVLDLSKAEATQRKGLRGFRKSSLPGADLSIYRRGAYFRVEWILAGKTDARQSLAFLLVQAPRGSAFEWMALETWCRQPGEPGLEDWGGEVMRRVEAFMLAFVEHWDASPDQRPVMASILAWPACFVPKGDGFDLQATAMNLGIPAVWELAESTEAIEPGPRKSIADMRSEFTFWTGAFQEDRSNRAGIIPADWLTRVAGWMECTSIDLGDEWGLAYYEGLDIRLSLYKAIARQMKDYLAEAGRPDVDTEFISAVGRGNPGPKMRAAFADQILMFASEPEAWMAEQVRLSATKSHRDEQWGSRRYVAAKEAQAQRATAHQAKQVEHLNASDEDITKALAYLSEEWGDDCPFVSTCRAQLEAGGLERESATWKALFRQYLVAHGRTVHFNPDRTFPPESRVVPGQQEALAERVRLAIAELGYFKALQAIGPARIQKALGDKGAHEARALALEARFGTEDDLGTWCLPPARGVPAWTRTPRRYVLAEKTVFECHEPGKHWSAGTWHSPARFVASGLIPIDTQAKKAVKAYTQPKRSHS